VSDTTTQTSTRYPDAKKKYERATKSLPGGNSRSQLYISPHPLYAASGQGARITLTDGRVLDDFLLNYTAAAVGYGHPKVVAAAREAMGIGGPFGMPTQYEYEFAEVLRERVPTLERVRFTNSGSEATLHAIRVARAFSGRPKIAKAEGAYHGSHDLTDFSVYTIGDEPLGIVPGTPGIPAALEQSIAIFPYNDLDGTIAVLDRDRGELAAVILEPFLNSAGAIPGNGDYLRGVADWCATNGVLLMVDEVAAFRASYSGVHSDHGITPDLLCLGKAIGGGFAIGAFGGRESVMQICDPRKPGHVKHAGTFNAHPVTMAAGMQALAVLDRSTIDRMNALGKRVIEGVREIGASRGIPLTAAGYGSIGNLHLAATPPRSAREALALPQAQKLDLYWALIERGFVIAPRGQFSISAVTESEQVDGLLAALEEAAVEVLGSRS
jgi:glutamate-1-semialdehyde 2,1-aminomutase